MAEFTFVRSAFVRVQGIGQLPRKKKKSALKRTLHEEQKWQIM